MTTALKEIGQKQDASAAEVATAYALAKGTTPIIGVTKEKYIASEKKAENLQLSGVEVRQLEQLADEANVNTKGSWENSMA